MHTSSLLIFFTAQPGIGTGDSDGQLGSSFHNSFVVLQADVVSNLSTSAALQAPLCCGPGTFQKPLGGMCFVFLPFP